LGHEGFHLRCQLGGALPPGGDGEGRGQGSHQGIKPQGAGQTQTKLNKDKRMKVQGRWSVATNVSSWCHPSSIHELTFVATGKPETF
jgi:hypothetical protein